MLSADECSAGYLSEEFSFNKNHFLSQDLYTGFLSSNKILFLIAGPVNSSTLPTLNLAKAVSVLTSLSNKEKAKVKKALETSSVQFAQMEDTFNKKRFKRKWVQSTVESSRLGQNTRMIDNLVATANKSKIIHIWKAF